MSKRTAHQRLIQKQRVRKMMSETNGDSPASKPGIPPDMEFEPGMIIYACSNYTDHATECDGSCQSMEATESQINLINEVRKWDRIGMSYLGVPLVLAGGPFSGINVDVFDTEMKVKSAMKLLIDKGIITADEWDEEFRSMKAEVLKNIRTQNEDVLREARAKAAIAVAKKNLLGPDGRPL